MHVDAEGRVTIPESVLESCRPQGTSRPHVVRIFCPIHGGDHQRSMVWDRERGSYYCHQCHAHGFTSESRARWRHEHARERQSHCWQCRGDVDTSHTARCPHCGWQTCPACGACADPRRVSGGCPGGGAGRTAPAPTFQPPAAAPARSPDPEPLTPALPNLPDLLARFQAALPGSAGERYLASRRIPPAVAQAGGVGYASPDAWPGRRSNVGRVVFPLTSPDGTVLNLYGRAASAVAPKAQKHDILSGAKGWFGGAAISPGVKPLVVTEGPVDALALAAAGIDGVVAILGTAGWRWPWVRGVRGIVLVLDADQAGQGGARGLSRDCLLHGRVVARVSPAACGGHDDPAAAWAAGVLDVAAIRRAIEEVRAELAPPPAPAPTHRRGRHPATQRRWLRARGMGGSSRLHNATPPPVLPPPAGWRGGTGLHALVRRLVPQRRAATVRAGWRERVLARRMLALRAERGAPGPGDGTRRQ